MWLSELPWSRCLRVWGVLLDHSRRPCKREAPFTRHFPAPVSAHCSPGERVEAVSDPCAVVLWVVESQRLECGEACIPVWGPCLQGAGFQSCGAWARSSPSMYCYQAQIISSGKHCPRWAPTGGMSVAGCPFPWPPWSHLRQAHAGGCGSHRGLPSGDWAWGLMWGRGMEPVA